MGNKIVFKLVTALVCYVLTVFTAYSQEQSIVIQFDELERDYLLIGDYVGKRFMIQDTIPHIGKSRYEKRLSKKFDGLYLVTSLIDKMAIQVIMNPDEERIEVTLTSADEGNPTFAEGSVNYDFLDYVKLSSKAARKQNKIKEDMKALAQDASERNSLQKDFDALTKEVQRQREKLEKKHKGNFLATLLSSQSKLDIPEFEGEEQQALLRRYRYRLDHYFDAVRNDSRFFRTKYFDAMVNNYVNEYTLKNRDSTYKSMVHVLDMVENNEKVFENYFAEWVNKYSESSVMGEEELFVRLALDYISPERTPFINDKTRQKLLRIANVQNNCLIGNVAINLTMPKLNIDSTAVIDSVDKSRKKYYVLDEAVSISDQADSLTVLFFWKSSCGHCKSAFPIISEIFDAYSARGLNVMAINVGNYKNYNEAARFIKKHKAEGMIHMVDPYYKSKYAESYYVKQTPAIFILDRNKKILINRMGVSQIKSIIEDMANKHLAPLSQH